MRRCPVTSTPSIVPLLLAGAHDRPEHGACFMEYASVLAGERFSDRPRCTHPVLAAACRAINDHVSDGARQGLIRYLPDVVGCNSPDPRVTAALVLACLDAAAHHCRCDELDDRARANAENRMLLACRGRRCRAVLRLTEPDNRAAGIKVVDAAVREVAAGGDAALRQLLIDLLETYHEVVKSPADGREARLTPVRHLGAQR